jgi:hypothetical protein
MIGMTRRQGPWPDCLGLTGDACAEYIKESTSTGTRTSDLEIIIVPQGSILTRDFNGNRVRIFVDVDNIVNAVPSKG